MRAGIVQKRYVAVKQTPPTPAIPAKQEQALGIPSMGRPGGRNRAGISSRQGLSGRWRELLPRPLRRGGRDPMPDMGDGRLLADCARPSFLGHVRTQGVVTRHGSTSMATTHGSELAITRSSCDLSALLDARANQARFCYKDSRATVRRLRGLRFNLGRIRRGRSSTRESQTMIDVILAGGEVIDGSGRKSFRADVGRCVLRPWLRGSAVYGSQRLCVPADLTHPAEVWRTRACDGAQPGDDRVGPAPGGRRRVRRHSPRLEPYPHQRHLASVGARRRRPRNSRTVEGPRHARPHEAQSQAHVAAGHGRALGPDRAPEQRGESATRGRDVRGHRPDAQHLAL